MRSTETFERIDHDRRSMSEGFDPRRRRLLGAAAGALAASQFGFVAPANAQAGRPTPALLPAIKPGTNTSFAPLKQIDAGLLNVGYAEAGPPAGGPVRPPAGWPHSISRFLDAA